MKISSEESKIKNVEEDQNIEDDKPEKQIKRTLFNDLKRFKHSNVSIIICGGEIVKGKLLGYDEVANCVIEDEQKKISVVFGKSVTMVCEGNLHPL